MVKPEIRALLDEQPWDLILKKLSARALVLMRRYHWKGELSGAAPAGTSAADLASEVVMDVYSGTRAWEPEVHGELYPHLCGILQSKLNNLSTSAENRQTSRGEQDEEAPDTFEKRLTHRTAESNEFVAGFKHELRSAPKLVEYVDCILGGLTVRRDIAEYLEVSVEEISQRKRQVETRLKQYILRKYGESQDKVIESAGLYQSAGHTMQKASSSEKQRPQGTETRRRSI